MIFLEGRREDSSSEDERDTRREQSTISHDEMERVRLSRDALEYFVDKPFFDELVVGFYVRILIGQNQGKAVYRVAEIVEVRDGAKTYKLASQPGANNKVSFEIFIRNKCYICQGNLYLLSTLVI